MQRNKIDCTIVLFISNRLILNVKSDVSRFLLSMEVAQPHILVLPKGFDKPTNG